MEVEKRSFRRMGVGTTVLLEPVFWAAVDDLAVARGATFQDVLVGFKNDNPKNLARHIRVELFKLAKRG